MRNWTELRRFDISVIRDKIMTGSTKSFDKRLEKLEINCEIHYGGQIYIQTTGKHGSIIEVQSVVLLISKRRFCVSYFKDWT